MIVRQVRAGDIEAIGAVAAEPWVRTSIREGVDLGPVLGSPWTEIIEIDGLPCAAGGFVDMGFGAALGWALVGAVPRHLFVPLCRAYRARMIATPFNWIEAHCAEGFEQAFRWVEILGFRPIKGAKHFAPDGREFRRFVFQRELNHGH